MADAKQIVEDGWKLWFQHDLQKLIEVYADDAEVVLPGMPPLRGKQAIQQGWQGFSAAIPDERPLSMKFIAEGNTVVTEWQTTGTNSGPMPMPDGNMMPPTGKTVTQNGVTVTEVENGKVKRQAFYWDNADFMQQLGVMPKAQTAGAR